jgi:flagellar basal-body rod protein FlgB
VDADVAGPVQLDMEVARMAQNAVHYQALLKGIEKQYAILSTAIADGKK